jgi:dTDP-4-dehydrorhamnose 3,5-epimerase
MEKVSLFSDVIKILPFVHKDIRGFFSEDYNKKDFSKFGIIDNFIQDNVSFSRYKNTIRGLHFQLKPFAQSKLLKVINGSIYDVFIDLREKSPTYGEFGSYNLSTNDGWIYIPEGFAHGFCTLEDNTIVSYKVNQYYNKKSELGILWNDPFFSIDWPLKGVQPIISDKDLGLPLWNEALKKINFR